MNTPDRQSTLAELARRLAAARAGETPISGLAHLQPALGELIGIGALSERDGQVRFSHESLRDFVFARTFVADGRSLADELREGGQDLSRRSLVRQVLGYQRGVDRASYSSTVTALLSESGIRFHMRDVVFEVLREDPAPSDADWFAIAPLALDTSRSDHQAAWSVVCQQAWFSLLDREGLVIQWLSGDDARARDLALRLVWFAQRYDPERVAVLLEPFVLVGSEWPERLRMIISGAMAGKPGRRYAHLVMECVDRGVFDDGATFRDDDLWIAVHDLPASLPDHAAALLAGYLARGRVLAGEEDPFAGDVFPRSEYWLSGFVTRTAGSEPKSFCDELLPPVIEIADATATIVDADTGLRRGDPWQYRLHSLQGGYRWLLYQALETSLQALALSRPATLRRVARTLVKRADIESMRCLLYRAWGANPRQFANAALDFLLARPQHLECDYYAATRALITAIQPECSPERLGKLEAQVMEYVPKWETKARNRAKHRFAQWQLLDAIGEANLSQQGCLRLRELREKFGTVVPGGPVLLAGAVRSPISAAEAPHLTKTQWLRAIRKYSGKEALPGRDVFEGGVFQLAQVLEAEAKRTPDRIARIATKLEPTTHPAYVDAVLRGLGDADHLVKPALLFDVLRHIYSLPGRPGGRWLSRPVARVADEDVPDDVLGMIVWYATEATDPESDAWRDRDATGKRSANDAYMAGINSVRGTATQALSALVWADGKRLERLGAALEVVTADETLAVRTCAALAVNSVFRHDTAMGLRLFARLTDADDLLMAAQPVEQVIAFVVRTQFAEAEAVLVRMVASDHEEVRMAAGRLSAFASLFDADAGKHVESALVGDVALRTGVAQVAAANVGSSEFRQLCSIWLERLFSDDDETVRDAATQWCRSVDAAQLDELRDLVAAYIESRAYSDGEAALLWVLDESPAAISDLGLRAVERFVNAHGPEIGDIRTRSAGTARTASKLAFRAYTSADSAPMRARALDVIDQLLEARVSQMGSLVQRFDEGEPVAV
jgi:hypothetical protein